MAVAILVSPKIFNFSELLELEVFQSLQNTEHDWLLQLMQTFNEGDVDQFYKDMETFKAKIASNVSPSTFSS